jgi:hypothetical protein
VGQAAGWYGDPFFRGQERYWNGRVWTQGTREAEGAGAGTVRSTPTLILTENPTSSSTSTEDGPADPADEAEARLEAAFASAGKLAHVEDDPPAEEPPPQSFAPLGAPVRPVVTKKAAPRRAKRKAARLSRHAKGGVATALVLVAGCASAAFLLVGSGNAAAQVAVANAAAQTMNSQSADMSLSIDVSMLGVHESVGALGAFDFANKTGTMTMTIPVNGQQLSEQEILDGSTIYVNVGNLSTGLAPSTPWVSEDVGQADNSGSGLNTMDPTAMLQQLQTSGGTVTSLGLTTYQGTSVTEYQATLPSSALMGEMGQLPSSAQQGDAGLNLPDMQMDIYVTQDNLLKALVLPSYSVSFSGQTMTMDMTLVLSNYGTPVTVTPPPADQTEPISQLGGGLGNSGTTGTSI